MLSLYKKIVIIVSVIFFFTAFIVSIGANILTLHHFWIKDDRIQAIETIIKSPSLFKIPEASAKRIKELYTIYNIINKENLNKYSEFGSTISTAKNSCITEALSLIGNSLTQDFRAYKIFTIGGLEHGLLSYAINMEKYSKDEIDIYMNNITKILEAIPRNLPNKDTLVSKPINSIVYYADHARIIYNIDKQIDHIDHDEETPNYGKRFEDKIKPWRKK